MNDNRQNDFRREFGPTVDSVVAERDYLVGKVKMLLQNCPWLTASLNKLLREITTCSNPNKKLVKRWRREVAKYEIEAKRSQDYQRLKAHQLQSGR